MALLEIPRYIDMCVEGKYASRTTYCLHILAGPFFFCGFSLVTYLWSGLLELGTFSRYIYSIHGLVISNVVFLAVDIAAVILCASSSSLMGFFTSIPFEVLTIMEASRNMVYSGFIAYFGLKLATRLWRHSLAEQRNMTRTVKDAVPTTAAKDSVVARTLFRFASVLFLVCMCFGIRIVMLALKLTLLHDVSATSSSSASSSQWISSMSLFGFWWFVLADFFPRGLAVVALCFLMGRGSGAGQQRLSSSSLASAADQEEYLLSPISLSTDSTADAYAFRYTQLISEDETIDDAGDYDESYSVLGTVYNTDRQKRHSMRIAADALSPNVHRAEGSDAHVAHEQTLRGNGYIVL